jgi:glutamate racemase
VIACNTATAAALERVRDEHSDIPVLGVIDPVCRRAIEQTRSGVIGVIGTRGTVRSGAYPAALRALNPDLQVVQQDCPLLVPLAEEGWLRGHVPQEVARTYLGRFVNTGIDTLILGCTHYPLLRPVLEAALEELLDAPVQVLDSATATAAALEAVLTERGLIERADRPPRHHFLVTDDVQSFEASCARFFGAPVTHVSHEDL